MFTVLDNVLRLS